MAMIAVTPPGAFRIGIALLIPIGILLLQLLFWSYIEPYSWALFYPCVFLASAIGGRPGGFGATALSTVLVIYFFVPPRYSLALEQPAHIIPALVFMAVGVLLCMLDERLRRILHEGNLALVNANTVLEQRVREQVDALHASMESVRTSERHLHTIVENLGEGIVLADAQGSLLFINQAAADILELKDRDALPRVPEEFIKHFSLDTLDGTPLPIEQWPMARLLRGEVLDGYEVRLTHRIEGWCKYLSFRGSSTDTPDVCNFVLVLTDITQRHQQEARFRALIEHSSDSVALIDADNRIMYLSPSVTAVEGYLPEELIGHSGIEHTHPDDLPIVQETVAKLLANPGKPFPALWRRRHKQGHWVWLEGVATNLLHEPAVKAIVTNYRDVSNRIYHEDRIRSQLACLALLDEITRAIAEHQDLQSILQVMIRSLEDGMPVDFCCVLFHDPVRNLLRVTRVGVKSAALARDLLMTEQAEIPIDQNGLSSCIKGNLIYEADLSQVAFPFPTRLCEGGLNSVVMVPLRAEEGVMGLLITARKVAHGFSSSDCEFLRQLSEHIALAITQTRLYAALQQAYDELHLTQAAIMQEERLRVLGQMASGIAHDINNALTPMLLYTELLLESEQALSERGRSYLEIIRQSVHDASQTVVRLRDFARPHDAASPTGLVQMNTLLKQVIDLAQVRWRDMALQHGSVIEVKTELQPDLPAIEGVESEIREALTNLIINAVDAMPAGGTLTLSTALLEGSDPPRISVEVRDTGVGMDEQTRQRCLEPFFTTKGAQGTGLGLAMVFGMTKRHAATFEIDSTPGQGTTMRLGFLIATEVSESTDPVKPVVQLRSLRLLLIDDDPILLNSLSEVLSADGHAVVTAGSGKEGLALFREMLAGNAPFDAVITDLGMPHMDGRQLAGWVKQASGTTPVLLLTGWGQRLIEEGDIPLQVDRVLAKPPMLPLLRRALAELCDKFAPQTAS